ncbi:MAG: OpgC domain-containing protein [Burkholderiaceae bacterium]
MNRRWELDLLRGFMLVMMFTTHLPTRFSDKLGQPFGYVSAAEGFVMLSAFMAGLVYTGRAQKAGIPAMRKAFFRRVTTVYACHAVLLLFLFSAIAALGLKLDQPALTNLIGFYLADPWAALPGALLLIYNPPLLDILPLYIMMLIASPFVLAFAMQRGWTGVFVISVALWACGQFPLSQGLYEVVAHRTGLRVPFSETGSFETLSWQFLWLFGLWMGAATAQGRLDHRKPFPQPLLIAAILVVLACLIWRHTAGQIPVPGHAESVINHLFDKWKLGPLRMLNLFALMVVIMHAGPRLSERLPRIGFLEKLGSASLPVFCMHLVVVLAALSIAGEYRPGRPLLLDVLMMAAGLAALYATALVTLYLDREEQERMLAARRTQELERARRAQARAASAAKSDLPT